MSEHLNAEQLTGYRERKISPTDLIVADDHLAGCEVCRRQINEPENTRAPFIVIAGAGRLATRDTTHLSYEELAAYVNRELDSVSREIADVHLEICRQCTEELRDLSEFSQAMSGSTPPRKEAAAAARSKFSLWPWSLPSPALQWAGAALAVSLVLGALTWIAFKSLRAPQPQVAQSNGPLVGASPIPSPAITPGIETTPSPQIQPEILVALNDGGGKVTLDKQGNLEGLNTISTAEQQAIKTALTNGRVNLPPAVADLKGKSGTLMGSASEGVPFALLNPVGLVVAESRPTFRWQLLKGASAYIVNIYDRNFNRIAASPRLSATHWTAATSLRDGQVYLWQVTAIKEGEEIKSPVKPAPEARFKILEQAKANELARLKRTHPNSHLLLGTLYAQAGLLDEAEQELRVLVAANPNSAVAQKLLHSLRVAR